MYCRIGVYRLIAIAAEMERHSRALSNLLGHLSISPAQPDRLSITDCKFFSQDLLRELGLEKIR